MNAATEKEPESASAAGWLLLFHQLPSKPDYLRVRVGRELRRLGAVALKNTVYVLPATQAFREGLAGVVREIIESGGDAVACDARFIAGLSDNGVEDRFRAARDAEYGKIATDARRLAGSVRRKIAGSARNSAARELERLRARFATVVARDPFGAGGRETAAGLLSLAEDRLQGVEVPGARVPGPLDPPLGATWVTRTGVMVDRIASAWLIRRFIDRDARFKFVAGHGHRPGRGEIRFDMAGAEFTHEGEQCTFEVLIERFRLRDSALLCIGEMVHDLDLEDGRFGRPETSGLGRMILGIALASASDETRIAQGATIFDGLYESFRKQSR